MKNKNKLAIYLFTFLLVATMASAVTVTDTTFNTSVTNYSVYIDSMTVASTSTTNTTITFDGLNSSGTNFQNTGSGELQIELTNVAIGYTIKDETGAGQFWKLVERFIVCQPRHGAVGLGHRPQLRAEDC